MDGHFADFRVNDKQNARCRRNGENPSILQYKHLIKKQTNSTAQRNTLLFERNELTAFHKKWGIYQHGKISDNC